MGRRQVKHKKARATSGEDGISNLPNNLLTHILSCLPSKDAVRTSILSRRWNFLWANVPCLEFRDFDFLPKGDRLIDRTSRKANFCTFMYRFLMRKDPCSIRKLHLRGSQCYDSSVIDSWISLAKGRKVQELQLEIYFYQYQDVKLPSEESRMLLRLSIYDLDSLLPYEMNKSFSGKLCLSTDDYYDYTVLEPWTAIAKEWNIEELDLDFSAAQEEFDYSPRTSCFPESWFTWETLKVLKLQGYRMMLDIPPSVSFPNIKEVHFDKIFFKDNNSFSQLISSGFPVLEELYVNRFDEDNIDSLIATSDTLKRLRLIFLPEMDSTYLASKTRIHAPALEYLHIEDEVTQEYVLEDFGALVDEADFNIRTTYYSGVDNRTSCAAFDLLNKTCNVVCLTLSDYTMLALQKTNSYNLPTFHQSTCLEIATNPYDRSGEAITLDLILEFLKRSTKLEVLRFKGIMFSLGETSVLTLEQDVPNCLESQLKTIEIGYLSFAEDELKVVHFFLMNSRVLTSLKIRIKGYNLEEKAVEESVLALPRGSSECLIEIGGWLDQRNPF